MESILPSHKLKEVVGWPSDPKRSSEEVRWENSDALALKRAVRYIGISVRAANGSACHCSVPAECLVPRRTRSVGLFISCDGAVFVVVEEL